MKISYSLMSHPTRLAAVDRIIRDLGRPCEIFVDTESRGPWHGARMAWEATPTDCDWRALLQDDIDLAPDFADTLESLLTDHGDHLASRPLSLCNCLPERAAPGTHWVERRDGVHGPCIVMAQPDVAPMLQWVAASVRETFEFMFDDIRVSLWLESLGRTALWPDPSWVQHRGWEPSLLGTKSTQSQPRVAGSYTGRPLRETDWTRGLEPGSGPVAGRADGASFRVRFRHWRMDTDRHDHAMAHRTPGVR